MPKVNDSPNKIVNRGGAGLLKKGGKTKLVNRGPAGLLKKPVGGSSNGDASKEAKEVKDAAKQEAQFKSKIDEIISKAKPNNIIKDLLKLAADINNLVPDPMNARVHPERNMEAIKMSLALYGQRTPLVVNRSNSHVIKGNGTLEAAKALHWTKIAVVWVDDDPVTAAGYGLADNRSAELARWDLETVARIDKLLSEAEQNPVGWSMKELIVLRKSDWLPPENPEDMDEDSDVFSKSTSIKLSVDEKEIFDRAVERVRDDWLVDNKKGVLTEQECLVYICKKFLEE